MSDVKDLPVRCPRCQEPKVFVHTQEKPARPYARCVACGWAGSAMAVQWPKDEEKKQ